MTVGLLWQQDSVFDVGAAFILSTPSLGAKPTAYERYIDICHPQVRIFQQHTACAVIGGTAFFIFVGKQLLSGQKWYRC